MKEKQELIEDIEILLEYFDFSMIPALEDYEELIEDDEEEEDFDFEG